MRIQEICGPNPERKTCQETNRQSSDNEPAWLAERSRTFISTGRLQLLIRSPQDLYCRKTSRDSMTSTLEDKIPTILDGFAAAYRRRQIERQQRAEWEELRDKAMEQYESQHIMRYVDVMSEQFHSMSRRREYLAALERSLEQYDGDDKDKVIRQVAELRQRVDDEDPGLHPECLVFDVPPPGDEDLEAFMDGWSASGPYHVFPEYGRYHRRNGDNT